MVSEALGLLKHALELEPRNAHARLYQSKLREEAAQDEKVGWAGQHLTAPDGRVCLCRRAFFFSPLSQVGTDEDLLKEAYDAVQLEPLPSASACTAGSCGQPAGAGRYAARGYRLQSGAMAEVGAGTGLTYSDFREQYLERSRPVVMRGEREPATRPKQTGRGNEDAGPKRKRQHLADAHRLPFFNSGRLGRHTPAVFQSLPAGLLRQYTNGAAQHRPGGRVGRPGTHGWLSHAGRLCGVARRCGKRGPKHLRL